MFPQWFPCSFGERFFLLGSPWGPHSWKCGGPDLTEIENQDSSHLFFAGKKTLPNITNAIDIDGAAKSVTLIDDGQFIAGDAVFDTTRTFNREIFRLEQHLDRLYESLRYMRIDPGMDKSEMKEITMAVLNKNLEILPDGEDYWVSQRVTRGVRGLPGGMKPSVVIECFVGFGVRGSTQKFL